MAEYMVKVKIAGAGTYRVGINGAIKGVYSPTSAISIAWDYNGEVGTIANGVNVWEPSTAFDAGKISKLVITATAATDVVIRME